MSRLERMKDKREKIKHEGQDIIVRYIVYTIAWTWLPVLWLYMVWKGMW